MSVFKYIRNTRYKMNKYLGEKINNYNMHALQK